MDDERSLIKRWEDVEPWLLEEARNHRRRRRLPPSAAFSFHDGQTSVVLETPMFCLEDADMITDELCRFLPQLRPDQLLVMSPAGFETGRDDIPMVWALQAHLGVRGEGWRTLRYPLPYDHSGAEIEPFECDLDDPSTTRIRSLLDVQVPPVHQSVLITPADERFTVYLSPDGRFSASTLMFGFN